MNLILLISLILMNYLINGETLLHRVSYDVKGCKKKKKIIKEEDKICFFKFCYDFLIQNIK